EVIDLCSGDGWFTLQIAKLARHVTAIDIDPAMLDLARHRLTESGVTSCDFVTGNAYELKTLVPGSADFVSMENAFHGVPDPLRLARAVRSLLRSSGHFTIFYVDPLPAKEPTVLGEPRGPKTEL